MTEQLIDLPQLKLNVEHIKESIEYCLLHTQRVMNEVFVDEIQRKDPLSILFEKKYSKYEKATAALYIISKIVPNPIKENYKKTQGYYQDKMPFDINNFALGEKIGSGGMNNVFIFKTQKNNLPSYVLKINHPFSDTEDINSLLQSAIKQKREYQRIKHAYESVKDLILDENYFLIHGPKHGKPAVAILQVFIGKNMKDIFKGLTRDDFVHLLKENHPLAKQLKDFIAATEADPTLLENELDLLGNNNLVIAGSKGEERLLFLDPHFRSIKVRNLKRKHEIKEKFDYLKEISNT